MTDSERKILIGRIDDILDAASRPKNQVSTREKAFVEYVARQFERTGRLTLKQRETIYAIWKKL